LTYFFYPLFFSTDCSEASYEWSEWCLAPEKRFQQWLLRFNLNSWCSNGRALFVNLQSQNILSLLNTLVYEKGTGIFLHMPGFNTVKLQRQLRANHYVD
jgi:hypothetical protein